jgi:hypothetical protein
MTLLLLFFLVVSLVLALVPAIWFHANLREYAPPARMRGDVDLPPISVLIPARNEQDGIEPAVRAALATVGLSFEVLVLDDHSEDATASIVNKLAAADPRVRLVHGPQLPDGWCGKQHACWILAHEARHAVLVFLDADVRLAPDALARMGAFLQTSGADLASGIPHQETVGFLERLVIPLVHLILLGFLPIRVMRRTVKPHFAAGCGQLFVTNRAAYERAGGHAAIRSTLHDGIKLPRAYREAGLRTDLFDATVLAECRMYRTAGSLWNGLAKNAGEALGSPGLIVPMTLVLLGGQVLPVVFVGMGLASVPGRWPGWALALALVALAAAYYPRLASVRRFRQPLSGALLHPLGVICLVAIQWYALVRKQLGRPASWKGRAYPPRSGLKQPPLERRIP